ncbi:hypothetical protein SNE40_004717 [Patella caerulea]|uniref:Small ribosomal subunit protein mS33 n=1 Tax=Patella caerulea TaxID=87958 RepID=A0AAN8K634_PATCE
MASNYSKRMGRLAARIFGEVARPTTSQSTKVVKIFSQKPLHLRPEVVNYYPQHDVIGNMMSRLRHLGLYRDEHMDFKEEMRRLKNLRGKAKPKKGEGKRALKRK